MTGTKVKICGLFRTEDIGFANVLRPDYIGFVFAEKSKRYITPEKAAELRAMLVSGIRAVGVFVNCEPSFAAGLAEHGVIDVIQLHGQEDVEYIRKLRELTMVPLIQAFQVEGPADLEKAAGSPADLVLLDHGAGGTGQAFDWTLLECGTGKDADLDSGSGETGAGCGAGFGRPFFLAAGINDRNAAEAVKRFRPYALDASSGLETDGVKDFVKMERLIKAVRGLT